MLTEWMVLAYDISLSIMCFSGFAELFSKDLALPDKFFDKNAKDWREGWGEVGRRNN